MFQLAGKVARVDIHDDGYGVMRLRREEAGLLGPEVKVLVPPLVFARDGRPAVGSRVELGAQSMAETGLSRRVSDCLLVARYIWAQGERPSADDTRLPPGEQPARGTGTN